MSPGRLRIGAALVLTAPFIPLLFQGEEWAASTPFLYFTDHQDPALAAAVREGRRKEFAPFGWPPEAIPDPQDPQTFERSKLRWDELAEPGHARMLEWHRCLLGLRRCLPDLTGARMENVKVRCSEEGRWLRVRRGAVEILVNLAAETSVMGVEEGATLELASEQDASLQGGDLPLPPDSVAIVRLPTSPVSGALPSC